MQESRPLGLILLFTVLGLTGQFLFKIGMSTATAVALVASLGLDCDAVLQGQLVSLGWAVWHTVVLVCQPYIVAGLVAYALSTVCWLAVLSKADLSFAYPMISIGYVAILLIDWACFGETVSLIRWLGVILISVGILGIYSERSFVRFGYWLAGFILVISALLAFSSGTIAPAAVTDKPVLLIMLAIPLGLIGQVLFKSGMKQSDNLERVSQIGQCVSDLRAGSIKALGTATFLSVRMMLSYKVFLGLFAYSLSTVVWLVMLTKVPLSFLYPLLSIGYVIILLIGWLGFHEQVTVVRWYGVFLICYGIVMIYAEELVTSCAYVFVPLLALLAVVLALVSARRRSSLPSLS